MMYDLIKDIIHRFGGRASGSRPENEAQLFFASRLEEFCSKVYVHRFEDPLDGWMGPLKFFCFLFYLSLVVFLINIPMALVIGLINAILFLGHFVMYRQWLDPIFPKQESSNVVGTIEPQEEVRSTIMVAGHMDSVYEFQWWYRFKQFGATLSVLSGFLIVLSPILFAATWSVPGSDLVLPDWANITWWVLVALSPITITLFSIHGEHVVDGAIDNLSGVAVAYGVGKELIDPSAQGKSILKHTRLQIMSFGCEEAGLKGSQAYVREHLDQLKADNVLLLNVDGIKEKKELRIVKAETFPMVKFDEGLIARAQAAFDRCDVPVKQVRLNVGATDSTAWAWEGLPTLCFIGMTSDVLDPTYHTRYDLLENLNPDGMEALKTVLVDYIKMADAELTSSKEG